MNLPIAIEFPPMEAQTATRIPDGPEWQFEPKWDGFRALVFRDGDDVQLQSKAGQALGRYFPELVSVIKGVNADSFILDGEIIIPEGGSLAFNHLLQRIHPAASRISKLAKETPAELIVFDLLVNDKRESLAELPLRDRRKALDSFANRYLNGSESIHVSPYTCSVEEAKSWFHEMTGGLDGIIAKRVDVPYASGTRDGMLKIKNLRTADCVVGGFRYATKGRYVGSLLLGLYDDAGLLHHVGFTSGIAVADREALTERVEKLISPPGFTGAAPGGPSRWATERSAQWEPLKPALVAEVQYDHFTGGRFRHGTRLLRWRPDKRPDQCTMKQLERESSSPMNLLKKK